mmetsp:Transcript_22375/g.55653  ORF Transcript_22375/g.55653 Transcript_22375/m.55653 type:complete len:80 (+) Transcript_22375:157-396(+)
MQANALCGHHEVLVLSNLSEHCDSFANVSPSTRRCCESMLYIYLGIRSRSQRSCHKLGCFYQSALLFKASHLNHDIILI